MPRMRLGLPVVAAATLLSLPTFAQGTVEGVWRTEQGTQVTITRCGSDAYCGNITFIVVPEEIMAANREALANMDPSQYFDANNPDVSLRSRPILGLQILSLAGSNPRRLDGTIYSPEDGNTYEGTFELIDDDSARLTGCGFFGMICRGERWELVSPLSAPGGETLEAATD